MCLAEPFLPFLHAPSTGQDLLLLVKMRSCDSKSRPGPQPMEKFARIIVGYHGCRQDFAEAILLGKTSIGEWKKSQNSYDWLGEGVYFWEHSPKRALRWAAEQFKAPATVIGAVIQLGNCFDLLDEEITAILANSYLEFAEFYRTSGRDLPNNRGSGWKLRDLDCAVINDCLDRLAEQGIVFDTVRGAFLEGNPIFPGTTISSETHIQIAVRDVDRILGIFRPNL